MVYNSNNVFVAPIEASALNFIHQTSPQFFCMNVALWKLILLPISFCMSEKYINKFIFFQDSEKQNLELYGLISYFIVGSPLPLLLDPCGTQVLAHMSVVGRGGEDGVNKALSDLGPCLLDILTVFVPKRRGGRAPLPLLGMFLRSRIVFTICLKSCILPSVWEQHRSWDGESWTWQ